MITIVGSGLTGATAARILTDAGHKVVVFDERAHEGGNVYTPLVGGVPIHHYGPHIFHTSSQKIWDFVNRFTEWTPYIYRPRARAQGQFWSFPVNLLTLNQIDSRIQTPADAEAWLARERRLVLKALPHPPQNLDEEWRTSMGLTLYHMFFLGYTKKQWGMHPEKMLPTISGRVPITTGFEENYFPRDRWQAMPTKGYSDLIAGLLDGIEVKLNTRWEKTPHEQVIYTGMLDALFDHDLGYLPYRSLDWEHRVVDMAESQGAAVINYCDATPAYTRTIEHWRFLNVEPSDGRVLISVETPAAGDDTNLYCYPLQTQIAQDLAREYRRRVKELNWALVGGRQGRYVYINMDEAINEGMALAEKAMAKWQLK